MGRSAFRWNEDLPISLHPRFSRLHTTASALPSFAGSKRKTKTSSPQRRKDRKANQEKEFYILDFLDLNSSRLRGENAFAFPDRTTPEYDLELKTPQAHLSGSDPMSVTMPGKPDAIHHRAWRRRCPADRPYISCGGVSVQASGSAGSAHPTGVRI